MSERIVMLALVTLLSADTFVGSYVGVGPAVALLTIPMAVVAYQAVVVRALLSPSYNEALRSTIALLWKERSHAFSMVLFLGLYYLSLVRAVSIGSMSAAAAAILLVRWIAVAGILLSVAIDAHRRGRMGEVLRLTVGSLMVYSVVNIFLYLIGARNAVASAQYLEAQQPGLMFGLVGLTVQRITLPLGGGINTGGLQSATGLALGIVLLMQPAQGRGRFWAGIVLSLASGLLILLTDSRGAMMAALGGALAALVVPRAAKRHVHWLAPALPILPLLMLVILQQLGNAQWVGALSRSGTSATGLLTGRPFIWASILAFFANFSPIQLVGFGALGQVGSGVALSYGRFFKEFANPYSMGAHNTLLQSMLDVGYLGAIVQIAVLWSMLRYYGEHAAQGNGDTWANAGFAAAVCLLLLGLTGETLSSTTPITLFLFLALNVHCLVSKRSDARGAVRPRPVTGTPAMRDGNGISAGRGQDGA